MNRTVTLFLIAMLGIARPMAAQAPNPFLPPQAKVHYEPERQYDLQHVKLAIKLDWANRRFSGRVTHRLELYRPASGIRFDAGPDLKIKACSVNGQTARFEHANGKLVVHTAQALGRGSKAVVEIDYESVPPARGRGALNGMYGFHWVVPDKFEPRVKPGFWTQGETEGNRDWIPIYDYPNDKTTSETIVEAPADWFVIGNGKLVEDRVDPKRKTRILHWSMTQPHATYLLSLAGGEMDVARSTWQGVDLYYCVPRGEGGMIPPSFNDTPDMLSFFGKVLGVKYPWPKYAETACFDFGGGMENVSATTLGEGSLSDPRSGIWPMAGLNSHELAHQWFGDLITCKDWGHIWLNEGFATFFEQLYTEHARGKDFYDQEREGALQSYIGESRRYKRPIVTRYYPHPDQMFDSHTYPKGGLVLHMLRREMGDEDFFKGLRHYLTKHEYQPVDTNDLVRSMQKATGRSLEAFFEQWVYKPGHPVIDYDWRYDEGAKEIVIDVKQLQDTKDGTPVYELNMPYTVITGSSSGGGYAKVEHAVDQIRLPAQRKPDAVLLDPGHDLLMERKEKKWQAGEREAVLAHAPCWLDRRDAAFALLAENPSDEAAREVVSQTIKTGSVPQIYAVVEKAGALRKHALCDLYRPLITHGDPSIRAVAVTALGRSTEDGSEDLNKIEALINEKESYSVVTAAIGVLGERGADARIPVFERAAKIPSRFDVVAVAALQAIAKSAKDVAFDVLKQYAQTGHSRPVRRAAIGLLEGRSRDRTRGVASLAALLTDEDARMLRETLSALGRLKDKSALPAVRQLEKDTKDDELRTAAKATAEAIEKP